MTSLGLLSGAKVLVADDDVALVGTLTWILKEQGCLVELYLYPLVKEGLNLFICRGHLIAGSPVYKFHVLAAEPLRRPRCTRSKG